MTDYINNTMRYINNTMYYISDTMLLNLLLPMYALAMFEGTNLVCESAILWRTFQPRQISRWFAVHLSVIEKPFLFVHSFHIPQFFEF